MDNHLIIFVRTPKTEEFEHLKIRRKQLKDYLASIEYIAAISANLSASKHVYYDSFIENDSIFDDEFYQKKVHKSTSLKQQLSDALKESFGQWAKKVVCLGTSSLAIDQKDIELVYDQLTHSDFVILPDDNGGVLLFGNTFFNPGLLTYYPWLNEDDLLDTIISLQKTKRTYCVLASKSSAN